MTNHDEGAPGRGVSGKSIVARAGDSVCGEINRMTLVRLLAQALTLSHPTLSPQALTPLTPSHPSHPRLSPPHRTLSPLSPHVLSTVTPQGCVTAEVTYGAAHACHEVLAWSRAT